MKRVEPGKDSGFLQDYSKLKPNEKMGGEALSYVNPDKMKSLHRYVAIIVDPVQVYVSTAADASDPGQWPGAVTSAEHALVEAVSGLSGHRPGTGVAAVLPSWGLTSEARWLSVVRDGSETHGPRHRVGKR